MMPMTAKPILGLSGRRLFFGSGVFRCSGRMGFGFRVLGFRVLGFRV